MTIDTIETAETVPAKTLIDQALENIKGYGRLVSVAPDRGHRPPQPRRDTPAPGFADQLPPVGGASDVARSPHRYGSAEPHSPPAPPHAPNG